MKKLLLSIGFALLCISSSLAQENSLLWKISGKDLKTESYILGTIHIMCEENFNIPEKVKKATAEVDQIIFEVDLSNPEAAAKAQQLAMTPNTTFFENYDPKKLAYIDSALTSHQFSIKMFDMVAPSTMISLLTLKSFACADPTKIKMMEAEIKALGANKKISDLESLDFQMDLLGKLATPNYFYEYFKNYNEFQGISQQMVDYYNTENIEGLKSIFQNTKYMSKDQFDAMLTNRNTKWVQDIPAKIQNTKSLIAVGAGHLVGDLGIIKLLRDKGYTLTPVK